MKRPYRYPSYSGYHGRRLKLNRISSPALAFLSNFAIVMILFSLCRIFFYIINQKYFPNIALGHLFTLLKGGVRFDLSALLYANFLCFLLQFIPIKLRYSKGYQKWVKTLFIISNSLMLIVNCIDIPYFRFVGRRTTFSALSALKSETNIYSVFLHGIISYWYVTLLVVFLIWILYTSYVFPNVQESKKQAKGFESSAQYYILHTIFLLGFFVLNVLGIKGGISHNIPLMIIEARNYANKGNEVSIVLNTPFCIIRTINNKISDKNPEYFKNIHRMNAIFSPVHYSSYHIDQPFKPLNVVIVILESFSKEFVGFFNQNEKEGNNICKGFTPFFDSLLSKGLTFQYSYANGRVSREAVPSILSSVPSLISPFFSSPYITDDMGSIASILKKKGYSSAFFHGAANGSMGFLPYAKMVGFDRYFGKNEYHNDKDFDGCWGIWDEEFLQFCADKINKMKQPFIVSIFTISSHYPFKIPKKYKNKILKGPRPIHECIRYTDYALRLFFNKISRYEWYKNTLFVLTADHTSELFWKKSLTDVNIFSIPIVFYHPGNPNLNGLETTLVQQIDIMPSILGYLNYDKPYFAFGSNIFDQKNHTPFVINYCNQMFQLLQNDCLLQFDGQTTKAVYHFKTDLFLKNNLVGVEKNQQVMETFLKAIIQQYIFSITKNKLQVPREAK